MVSLSAVVPATDRPATLGRCLDAIARRPRSRRGRRRGAAVGAVRGRCAQRRGAAGRGRRARVRRRRRRGAPRRVRAHPRRLRRRSRPGRGVRLLRRRARRARRGVGLPQPARTTTCTTRPPGRRRRSGPGSGAVRRDAFLAVGGFDAERYAVAVDRGHRARDAAACRLRRARSSCGPTIQGTHLKAGASVQMLGRTSRAGVPWVALDVDKGGSRVAEPRLAPPAERGRSRRRRRGRLAPPVQRHSDRALWSSSC